VSVVVIVDVLVLVVSPPIPAAEEVSALVDMLVVVFVSVVMVVLVVVLVVSLVLPLLELSLQAVTVVAMANTAKNFFILVG